MHALKTDLIHFMNKFKTLTPDNAMALMSHILADTPIETWEIGPHPLNHDIDVLALSSDGISTVEDFIYKTVEPDVDGAGWEIVHGIPPRDWELFFEYSGANGQIFEVEGADWSWQAHWNEDGLDLTLVPDQDYPPDVFDDIARILMVGELGEKNCDKYVILRGRHGPSSADGFDPLPTFRSVFAQTFEDCAYREFLKRPQAQAKP